MVWTAVVDLIVGTTYFTDDRATLVATAEATAIKALSLVPSHAFAHLVLGVAILNLNRAAEGMAEFERALALDRNLAEAHAQIGTAKHVMGRAAETEAHINQAIRLSPRDIFAFRWFMMVGFAKLQLKKDSEALHWLRRSLEANRNYPFTHFVLAATLALLGSLDEAKAAAKAGLALLPSFTIRRFRDGAPSDNPIFLAKRERVYEGMRLAGYQRGDAHDGFNRVDYDALPMSDLRPPTADALK